MEMTNLEGLRQLGKEWSKIDRIELRAYVGLLLFAGVFRSYGEFIGELWDDFTGRTVFRATMSMKRFKEITRMMRFDDKGDRAERRSRDKLAPIREVFDKWSQNLKTLYNPGPNVTVDEQLIPFRGRCPFTQYIPSKPAKYGIKVWACCDSDSFYALNMQIYTGRAPNCKAEINQGQRVVLEVTEGLIGRNITCDNFFTGYDLAVQLKKRKSTLLGTVRKNKKCVPPYILDMKRQPIGSSRFLFDHSLDATIVSYVPKQNRLVVLFSTMHHENKVSNEEHKKPQIILDYNKTKGGVDSLDQMVGTYTCKRKVRWITLQNITYYILPNYHKSINSCYLFRLIDGLWPFLEILSMYPRSMHTLYTHPLILHIRRNRCHIVVVFL